MKLLFEHAKILYKKDSLYEILDDAYFLISGDTISYFGKNKPNGVFDRIIDARNKLIMPGLVNAHGHSAMTLLKGVGKGLTLQDWLEKAIFPIEAKLIPDDVEAGNAIAIMEMLSSGTTMFSDMYDFPYRTAEVIAKSKIKANICRVGLAFDEKFTKTRLKECIDIVDIINGKKQSNEELKREINKDRLPIEVKEAIASGRLKADFCLHSEYLTNEQFVKEIVEANKTRNQKEQVHASETILEHEECKKRHGKTPIEYLYSLGYLDNGNAYIAHCVHVEDHDLNIIKETGSTIVHNPVSNYILKSGYAPIKLALQKGVKIAIGTDGSASNDSLDMFKEMTFIDKTNNGEISFDDIIDMATVNGAHALGRYDTGEIKIDKKADIILLDLTKNDLLNSNDLKSAIIRKIKPSNVYMTIVDGKILYENGVFNTINKQKACLDFDKALHRLALK